MHTFIGYPPQATSYTIAAKNFCPGTRMTEITPRSFPAAAVQHLHDSGYSSALAKIFAARGITDSKQLDTTFAELLPCDALKNAREMAGLLADAMTMSFFFAAIASA